MGEKAMHQAGSDSILYVITDDWIKDMELAPKIERLAVQKRITLNFMFTFADRYRQEWKSNARHRLQQKNTIKKLRRITNGFVNFSNLKDSNARRNVLKTLRSHITKKTTTGSTFVYTKEAFASKDDIIDRSNIAIDSTIMDAELFRMTLT